MAHRRKRYDYHGPTIDHIYVASGFGDAEANGSLGPALGYIHGVPYYQCAGGWWFYGLTATDYVVSSTDPNDHLTLKYGRDADDGLVQGNYNTRGSGTDPGGVVV